MEKLSEFDENLISFKTQNNQAQRIQELREYEILDTKEDPVVIRKPIITDRIISHITLSLELSSNNYFVAKKTSQSQTKLR